MSMIDGSIPEKMKFLALAQLEGRDSPKHIRTKHRTGPAYPPTSVLMGAATCYGTANCRFLLCQITNLLRLFSPPFRKSERTHCRT